MRDRAGAIVNRGHLFLEIVENNKHPLLMLMFRLLTNRPHRHRTRQPLGLGIAKQKSKGLAVTALILLLASPEFIEETKLLVLRLAYRLPFLIGKDLVAST